MSRTGELVGPRRDGDPPGPDLFARSHPSLGARRARLGLASLSIAIEGMDDAWHAAFMDRYRPYSGEAAGGPGGALLTLAASRSGRPHYIEPPPAGEVELNPVWLFTEPDPTAPGHWRVRVCTYTLAASFSTAGGRGSAVFSATPFDGDPRERAVENILRVATAWLALARGGLLMHSASIVRDGRAWLFFGQSGAGKSTLAASTSRGQVVSDDLTLLLPDSAGRMEVVGSPFRGTYTAGHPVQGRFPVVAALRLRWAAASRPAEVERLDHHTAMSEAIANLPFVVDQLPRHPELFAIIEKALGAFPILTLRFHKGDDSWWEAIEAIGPGSSPG